MVKSEVVIDGLMLQEPENTTINCAEEKKKRGKETC
jgi:hypothetical protein